MPWKFAKGYGAADTILKKYSSTIATIFTGIASAVLFDHTLTINFVLGISIVIISMHQFFSALSKVKDEQQSGSVEMVNSQDRQRYAFFLSRDASFLNMTAGANEDVRAFTSYFLLKYADFFFSLEF
ncbi:hypothetical protein CRYUN_Cryun09bG0154800 [Craigia yunnanensis]